LEVQWLGMSIVVLGVGNMLHSDDGAGPAAVQFLSGAGVPEGIFAFDCGTAPENFTGVVRRIGPDLVVIVDAALMGLAPGSIRRIGLEEVCDVAVGTHMVSLGFLAGFLRKVCPEVVVLGIEPVSLDEGVGLSDVVECAVREVAGFILYGKVGEFEKL